MENIQKAVVMAGEVFLFVLALTIGILMYTTLINTQETILIASEENSLKAESAIKDSDGKFGRVASGAEAVMSILSLLDNTNYVADEVRVEKLGGGLISYRRDDLNDRIIIKSTDLYTLFGNNKYDVSYSFSGADDRVTVIYRINTDS